MGIYEKYMLPKIINVVMQNPDMAALRRRVVPEAEGDVIEVGFGSGHNLPFYSDAVRSVTGIDPSVELKDLAVERISEARVPIEIVNQSAEEMPFENAHFDSAVVTWTFCTVPSAEKVLSELRRVLKPGGQLMFVEHGRSPDAKTAKWQDRVNPIWKPIGGGCNINRKIDEAIRNSGFNITDLDHPAIKGPAIMTYQYLGRAIPG